MKDKERERLEKRIADQNRELEDLRKGSEELQAAVDALLTAVALDWGEAPPSGEKEVRELRLARFQAGELRRRYQLRALRQGEGYLLRVSPRRETEKRGKEKGHGGKKT